MFEMLRGDAAVDPKTIAEVQTHIAHLNVVRADISQLLADASRRGITETWITLQLKSSLDKFLQKTVDKPQKSTIVK